MGVIALPNTISTGDVDNPSRDMTNWSTLYNEFNGNIEDANVKNASITGSTKLIDNTVTPAKIYTVTLATKNYALNPIFRDAATRAWTLTNFASSTDATSSTVSIDTAGEQIKSTTDGATGIQELLIAAIPSIVVGSTISAGIWCKSDSSTTEFEITDDADNSFGSAQHTGGNTWEFLTVNNKTIGAGDTSLKFKCKHNGTAKTSYFTGLQVNAGTKCFQFSMPSGSEITSVRGTTDITKTTSVEAAMAGMSITRNVTAGSIAKFEFNVQSNFSASSGVLEIGYYMKYEGTNIRKVFASMVVNLRSEQNHISYYYTIPTSGSKTLTVYWAVPNGTGTVINNPASDPTVGFRELSFEVFNY